MALNLNIIFRDFRVLLRFSRLKSDLESHRRRHHIGVGGQASAVLEPSAGGGGMRLAEASAAVLGAALGRGWLPARPPIAAAKGAAPLPLASPRALL